MFGHIGCHEFVCLLKLQLWFLLVFATLCRCNFCLVARSRPLGLSVHVLDHLCSEDGYCVKLPEKLSTGKWNVYRYLGSCIKLILIPEHQIFRLQLNIQHRVKSHMQ